MTKMYKYTAEHFTYVSTLLNERTVITTINAKIFCNKAQVATLPFTGAARCHENDTFDYVTGVTISTLRAEQLINDYLTDKNIDQF